MKKDITIILTLYNTPKERIIKLSQYKDYKILIFEQEGSIDSKQNIKNLAKVNFEYYFSKIFLNVSIKFETCKLLISSIFILFIVFIPMICNFFSLTYPNIIKTLNII